MGAVPVPGNAELVPLPYPYGADDVSVGSSTAEDSMGPYELAGPVPTVTVTVLAEVMVTVAGPHSSPTADEPPIGELPKSLLAGDDSIGE